MAIVVDETTLCDTPAGFIPGAALPYVLGAWALFAAAPVLAAMVRDWNRPKGSSDISRFRSKLGVVVVLDLVVLPVLWFVTIIIHVVQCIG